MVRPTLRLALLVLATTLTTACNSSSSKASLPRRLYVCDDGTPNTVSVYKVAADGTLTELDGSPFLTGGDGGGYGGQSSCIRIHAASRRLYAANVDSVSVFSIDEKTGALTLLSGSPSPVAAARSPEFFSLEVSKDGTTVFLPDDSNGQLVVATLDANGNATEIAGSPYDSTGASVVELALGGGYLYVQPEDNFVDAFQVAAGGTLTELTNAPFTYDPGGGGFTMRVSPSGTELAVGAEGGVSVFELEPGTGDATLALGSPFAGPGTVGSLAWTPSGGRLYVGAWESGDLHGWSVGADGVLTPLAGSPWTTDLTNTAAMTFSSDGKLLFVGSQNEGLAVFSVDGAGTPTEISGSPFAANSGDMSHFIFTP